MLVPEKCGRPQSVVSSVLFPVLVFDVTTYVKKDLSIDTPLSISVLWSFSPRLYVWSDKRVTEGVKSLVVLTTPQAYRRVVEFSKTWGNEPSSETSTYHLSLVRESRVAIGQVNCHLDGVGGHKRHGRRFFLLFFRGHTRPFGDTPSIRAMWSLPRSINRDLPNPPPYPSILTRQEITDYVSEQPLDTSNRHTFHYSLLSATQETTY